MESSGIALRRIPYNTGSIPRRESGKIQLGFRPSKVHVGSGFSNEGHLQYYASPPTRCGGGTKKEEKKRMKMIKGLSKDLSAFYSMGFGVETGEVLVGERKGQTISEAADILLAQLEQLRAAEKEMKKKRKEEKAAMKAAQMKKRDCEDSSSSSSSESSDSDCEEVIGMSKKRNCALLDAKIGSLASVIEAPELEKTMKSLTLVHEPDGTGIGSSFKNGAEGSGITSGVGTSTSCSAMVRAASSERIEVCMGGKCKKSGAPALMEEFERRVNVEGAVVSCKCMGKCKDGPNIRILSHSNEEYDSVRIPKNPLCIGVGLEDVGVIVAKFFGESKDLGLQAA